MRELIAEFMTLQPRPEIAPGEVLLLGLVERRPDLAALREGEQVILIDPGNLRAIGTVTARLANGLTYWYGVITGAVEDIHP